MRQISTTFIFMIATLAIGIVLLLIIFQFRIFGTGFFLGACEGEIEGVRCDKNTCPGALGTDIVGIDNPICNSFTEKPECIFTYGNVTIGPDKSVTLCEWFEPPIIDRTNPVNPDKRCLMNPAVSCSVFAGSARPTCEQVFRCEEKSIAELMVERAFGGLL